VEAVEGEEEEDEDELEVDELKDGEDEDKVEDNVEEDEELLEAAPTEDDDDVVGVEIVVDCCVFAPASPDELAGVKFEIEEELEVELESVVVVERTGEVDTLDVDEWLTVVELLVKRTAVLWTRFPIFNLA
jgi:hypothetical protein